MSEAKKKSLEFLKNHTLAAIATVSSESTPHVANVYYVVDDDLQIYCVTRTDTSKFQNIKNNPIVALVVTDEETVETVQLIGKAMVVKDETQASTILEKLWKVTLSSQSWPAPIVKISSGDLTLLKIKPKELKFGSFKPIHLEDGKDPYFEKASFS
jgi:general stress protein 26